MDFALVSDILTDAFSCFETRTSCYTISYMWSTFSSGYGYASVNIVGKLNFIDLYIKVIFILKFFLKYDYTNTTILNTITNISILNTNY